MFNFWGGMKIEYNYQLLNVENSSILWPWELEKRSDLMQWLGAIVLSPQITEQYVSCENLESSF